MYSLLKDGEADFDTANWLKAGNCRFIECNICSLFSTALQQFKEDQVCKTLKYFETNNFKEKHNSRSNGSAGLCSFYRLTNNRTSRLRNDCKDGGYLVSASIKILLIIQAKKSWDTYVKSWDPFETKNETVLKSYSLNDIKNKIYNNYNITYLRNHIRFKY